jgi:hypothetical protein
MKKRFTVRVTVDVAKVIQALTGLIVAIDHISRHF